MGGEIITNNALFQNFAARDKITMTLARHKMEFVMRKPWVRDL